MPVTKKRRFRLLRRKKKQVIIDEIPVRAKAQSLGVGTLSSDGISIMDFVGSTKSCCASESNATSRTLSSSREDFDNLDPASRLQALRNLASVQQIKDVVKDKADYLAEKVYSIPERIHNLKPDYKRLSSTFLRVADLQMTSRVMTIEDDQVPNFHHASQDPPPGMEMDPQEEWVALDDGAGSAAPIAPYAVAALASFGHKTAMDQSMWKCEGRTDRILKSSAWKNICWQTEGPITLPEDFPQAGEVTIWSGTFIHGLYGSDLPAIRSMGIVNMAPKALVDLMVDSSRTKEYNKMSLGRTDLLVLHDNLYEEEGEEGPFGKSITKVMRAETQPPVIRKPLQFVSILHATKLKDGYLIVSRAVTQATSAASTSVDSMLHSEILMGVNVIRHIEGEENKCLMINVNHIRTPMVPLFVARRIALSAAPGFIHDLNSLC